MSSVHSYGTDRVQLILARWQKWLTMEGQRGPWGNQGDGIGMAWTDAYYVCFRVGGMGATKGWRNEEGGADKSWVGSCLEACHFFLVCTLVGVHRSGVPTR